VSAVAERDVASRTSPRTALLALAAGLAAVAVFLAGVLVGSHQEPSEHLRVDRDVRGTVLKVGQDGAAVVIDTDRGHESFQLLGDVPAPGDEVEGVVVELTGDGVSVEAVVLH
jgi:hypothetical protein